MLAAYGIPTVETRVAASEDEAVEAADAIGYPVVLKLLLRDDHPQDRRRRRAAEPGKTMPRARGVPADPEVGVASRPGPSTSRA